jgi:hypothetical protein
MRYTGGCHCGRIRFEAEGELQEVTECNCTICAKAGYLHWMLPREQFKLLTPEDQISTYIWHTGTARHYFCPVCGVSPFRRPRRFPGGERVSVNARCLDGVEVAQLRRRFFDGLNQLD